ncbi:hypothetical protein G9A89_001649 [Geosiphon pyriformis]|nr:hypothetical protein G9A89_001649 [Geosiphon pyriformis]
MDTTEQMFLPMFSWRTLNHTSFDRPNGYYYSRTEIDTPHNEIPGYYSPLENTFGLLGTLLWSLQLLPQGTLGTKIEIFSVFASIFFGIYAVLLNLSIPLMAQPQIFGLISLLCHVQCLYYENETYYRYGNKNKKDDEAILSEKTNPEDTIIAVNEILSDDKSEIETESSSIHHHHGKHDSIAQLLFNLPTLDDDIQPTTKTHKKLRIHQIKITLIFCSWIAFLGAIQVGGVLGIKEANKREIEWPETVLGVFPVILLLIGFIPQYYEIYCNKEVQGISFLFLGLDMMGAAISIVSLVFRKPPFDTVASLTYASVFSCDAIIVILYFVLNRLKRKKSTTPPEMEEVIREA